MGDRSRPDAHFVNRHFGANLERWKEANAALAAADGRTGVPPDPFVVGPDCPAGTWHLGGTGEGCGPPGKTTTASGMAQQVLIGAPEAERARDRLAWAAAVVLGERACPEHAGIRQTVRALEDAILTRVAEGVAGIQERAQAEAPAAFERLVHLSCLASDQRTKYAATLDVLGLAGIAPQRKVEVTHRDAVLDSMSRQELERYARTGQWPTRLQPAVTTVAAAEPRDDS
jgi:hypothetical protein